MSTARRLVVTGATGKQGGALISALLSKPQQPFKIYAVTRNPSSRAAQALASKPNVHIVKGNFDDAGAIFRQVDKPWGVFSVTMPMNPKTEERQGKAVTKAAVDAGVQHIVFTSTERGGQETSGTNPTNIPHFVSKYNIEQDIMAKAAESKQGLTWTFLRPVAFLENVSDNFLGKAFVAMWVSALSRPFSETFLHGMKSVSDDNGLYSNPEQRLNDLDRELQMISTKDIGKIAAEAFLNADKDEYRNKAISLAGDQISPNEAARIFKQTTGQEIPATYGFVGSALRWTLKEQLGLMFDWFKDTGFGVDVDAVRRRYPFMQDFGTWLAEESAWKK